MPAGPDLETELTRHGVGESHGAHSHHLILLPCESAPSSTLTQRGFVCALSFEPQPGRPPVTALAWSLPWSRESSLPPQQLHTAGSRFPRAVTYLPSVTCPPSDCPGLSLLLRLDPLRASVTRAASCYALPQTLNNGVTLHRGVESEGSRGTSHGELGCLCLDKGILGPHCNPQYDREEARTCFVSTQGSELGTEGRSGETGVCWASTPCQALKSSVRDIVTEEVTWAGRAQELALIPLPRDSKAHHTDFRHCPSCTQGKGCGELTLIHPWRWNGAR